MKRGCCAVLAAMCVFATAARADVYEWRDQSGARHFTNDKQGVPLAYRDSATVLIADWERPAPEPKPQAALAPVPAPPAPQTPVVAQSEPWTDAYAAGMRAAFELGGGGGGGGGSVQINGPLAIAVNRSEQDEVGDGGFYPPWPWYYPFVTTSFDRGRSRHQTLRMLLQDQFQMDRDGPYAYDRWDQPGVGPALAPFLSRGLPYGVGQYGRVIYR